MEYHQHHQHQHHHQQQQQHYHHQLDLNAQPYVYRGADTSKGVGWAALPLCRHFGRRARTSRPVADNTGGDQIDYAYIYNYYIPNWNIFHAQATPAVHAIACIDQSLSGHLPDIRRLQFSFSSAPLLSCSCSRQLLLHHHPAPLSPPAPRAEQVPRLPSLCVLRCTSVIYPR
jgi:hypothetical protein